MLLYFFEYSITLQIVLVEHLIYVDQSVASSSLFLYGLFLLKEKFDKISGGIVKCRTATLSYSVIVHPNDEVNN